MNGNVGLFLTKFRRNLKIQSLTFEGFKKTRGALDSAFCVPWSLSYSKKTPFSGAQNPYLVVSKNCLFHVCVLGQKSVSECQKIDFFYFFGKSRLFPFKIRADRKNRPTHQFPSPGRSWGSFGHFPLSENPKKKVYPKKP